MRFGIWVNPARDPQYRVRDELIALLTARGAAFTFDELAFSECDLIISLGGDGTFLSTAHLKQAEQVPCVGVNLGSVGFLTEIERSELPNAVDALTAGRYRVENRMMLSIDIYNAEGSIVGHQEALNDVVTMRDAGARILTADLSINGNPVERIPGDGIIVSTPTGSTAYSLAAGGPIVHPSMELFLITPICPHSLHNRSYLAPADAVIELSLNDAEAKAVVNADGKSAIPIKQGRIAIKKSERYFKLVRLGRDQFYETLPRKIQQRGMIK